MLEDELVEPEPTPPSRSIATTRIPVCPSSEATAATSTPAPGATASGVCVTHESSRTRSTVPVVIPRARWSPCRDGRERLRLCPRGLYGAPSWESNCPANGRHAAVPVTQPNALTWTAVGGARRVLLAP